MMQDITGQIRRDGNLLGYVNHKNPLIFSDSFDSAIRSEWSKWVNSGNWQDYIQAVNGKLRFQYTGTGAYDGGVLYPLPAGDWEIRVWMSGIENPNQTCIQYLLLRQDANTHYKVVYMFTAPSTYTMRVLDHNWATLWSMTGNEASTWRIRFQNGKLSFYRKPDSGSESLVVTTTSQIGLNDVYFNFRGNSDGFSGTVWMDDFCLTRLNHPRTYNMMPAHQYTRKEYSGNLLLDYLAEAPVSAYLLRNRGWIFLNGKEYSGLATFSDCEWRSKDGVDAAAFNGSNSVIKSDILAHPFNMVSDKFTITAWAYIDPAMPGDGLIMGKTSPTVSDYDWGVLALKSHKGLSVWINGESRLITLNSWEYNCWHHFAVTFDRTLGSDNVKAYVDGSLVGQATYTTAVAANSKNIYIGSRNLVAELFKGYLRNIRLYNAALSQEEIMDEMQRDYIPPVETYTKELSSITGTEEPPLQVKYY